MKLQLKITTPEGSTRSFEHVGPVVRIGREPGVELSLQGDDGRSVSWNHARIDLAAYGATLADLGSSNGTLLNDQKLDKPMPLRVGDRIQLGYTGVTLLVRELDLSVPVSSPAAARRPLPARAYIVAAAVGGVLLIAGGLIVLKGKSGERTDEHVELPNPPGDITSPPILPVAPKSGERKPADPGAEIPSKEPEEKSPAAEVREVGRFVASPKWGPAVLLQRQGEAYPWTPLRPESKVATDSTFVSLPGYRSTLALDSGVHLTLWGEIPEFSAFPPVLESVVMLNVPAPGVDLDVTLERGRIHLVNTKASGPCRVKLRFLSQEWQLTLPEPRNEACLELWPILGQSIPGPGQQVAPIAVGLFIKGKAQLQAAERTFELADRSRASWVNVGGAAPQVEVLKELPEWWVKPPDRQQPAVADAMVTLVDWSNYIGNSDEVVDTILTRIRESKDATLRVVGLLFLAALDETPFLVDFLEDRQHAEVRGTARHALQVWLNRRADSQAELARILKEKRGYSREKGELIGGLLHRIADADLNKPETYQKLIGYLDHENLMVRDLAYWHLALLVPQGAEQIAYDPLAEANQRQSAIRKWQELVPSGKVPRVSAR